MSTIHINASASKNPVPSVSSEVSAVADLAKWAVTAPLLAKSRVTAIFGLECTGKSALALFIAHAVALGDRSFGDLGEGPVLYITNEGENGIPKRLTALAKMYGPRPSDSLHLVFGINDLDGRALDRIKAIVRQCKPSLVIIDGTVTTFVTAEYRRVAEEGRAVADLGPAVALFILDRPGPDDPRWLDADFDEQMNLVRADDEPYVYGETRGTLGSLSNWRRPHCTSTATATRTQPSMPRKCRSTTSTPPMFSPMEGSDPMAARMRETMHKGFKVWTFEDDDDDEPAEAKPEPKRPGDRKAAAQPDTAPPASAPRRLSGAIRHRSRRVSGCSASTTFVDMRPAL
ncbi:AAA family ATPase [Mesorhizobium atlanticum]